MVPEINTIIITGTPGTGKTSVSRLLSTRTGYIHIDTARLALAEGRVKAYDYVRDTYIIDEEALKQSIKKRIEDKKAIIDTHYPCIVEDADIVVVLRTENRELKERLKNKGWSPIKIEENLESEIIGNVLLEAKTCQRRAKIIEIDTTNKKPEEVADIIINKIKTMV